MRNLIKWCAGFFEEEPGIASSARFLFLGIPTGIMLVWGFLSIIERKMQEIPWTVVTFAGLYVTNKIAQKLPEVKREIEEIKAKIAGTNP